MQTVRILIEENVYGAVRPMELAATAPVSALVPAIVEELKLPQTDLFGNKLVYMLRHTSGGPVLPENKSLVASGIGAGAKLALDSFVREGSVVTLFQGERAQAQPAFYSSQTMADVESFPVLGKDTSASLPAVGRQRKGRRWTRRAFLVLGGAALGAGAVGVGYAAYQSLVLKVPIQSSLMHAPVSTVKTKPIVPQQTVPGKATSLLVFSRHQQTVRSVMWSPNGNVLASGANDAELLIWDTNGTVQVRKTQVGAVRAVAWSPDGRQLAIGAANQVIFLNPLTGTALANPGQRHNEAVTSLAWSPQQPLQVVSGGLDKRAVVWNTSTYTPQTIFNGHTTGIESVCWAADGKTIGSSSLGGVVRIWNAGDGQQVHGFFMDAQLPMRAVSFASASGQLAVGGDDGIVRFWNGLVCSQQVQVNFGIQCLDVPQRLHAHAGRVRTLAWSPDARFLATGGDDGVLAIWYPGQRQAPLLKVKHDAPVLALAWSSTGKEVATASGNTVTIWGLS